ncbi:MAG: dethiobiotin synthase [Betaproteobacteria bacterium]|uniref:ATP-dependent dethiobiotin synthetase BioD n=1 Tax=Candidatus Proximibacter danicus TaxID=2954365 RepID=A0A9D7PPE6_9PROT|nr:dethiobiotin synthase [Candidatus Proximibacter danicus]
MTRAYFITGTDTEIGKTYVACALLHAFRQQGLTAIGMKPVAAGTDAAGHNEDVEALIAASSITAPRELVNPYCFADPIAPHIAAREAGVTMRAEPVQAALQALGEIAEVVVVEGVGGLVVPLGENFDAADLAEALSAPLILVVGMRLGCLNHALLTAAAIDARGLKLTGWIANRIDPAMNRFEENLATLQAVLKAPLLGVVPHAAGGVETAAASLDLSRLR